MRSSLVLTVFSVLSMTAYAAPVAVPQSSAASPEFAKRNAIEPVAITKRDPQGASQGEEGGSLWKREAQGATQGDEGGSLWKRTPQGASQGEEGGSLWKREAQGASQGEEGGSLW
jgi:hypothetical protein